MLQHCIVGLHMRDIIENCHTLPIREKKAPIKFHCLRRECLAHERRLRLLIGPTWGIIGEFGVKWVEPKIARSLF